MFVYVLLSTCGHSKKMPQMIIFRSVLAVNVGQLIIRMLDLLMLELGKS